MRDALEVRAVRVAHALNALVVLGTFGAALLHHRQLPARVPVHFDLAGLPDRWADRSWGTTLAAPLLGLAATALLYASAGFLGWLRRHPRMVNLPSKDAFLALPPELQDPVWRQLKAMVHWLAVPQTLVFLAMVALAPGEDGRLRIWPVLLPAAAVVVLPIWLGLRVSAGVREAIAAAAPRPDSPRKSPASRESGER
jgi:uncharacterized membrane protein